MVQAMGNVKTAVHFTLRERGAKISKATCNAKTHSETTNLRVAVFKKGVTS
jgi:hypothetical protein